MTDFQHPPPPPSTTKDSSSRTGSGGCPYAAALQQHNHHNHTVTQEADDDHPSHHGRRHTPEADAMPSIQDCPVFQNGSCPFAHCRDEAAIRAQLLTLPASHRREDTTTNQASSSAYSGVRHVLQELHAVAGRADIAGSPKYAMGACPVAGSMPVRSMVATSSSSSSSNPSSSSHQTSVWSAHTLPATTTTTTATTTTTTVKFTHAMEGYSLAAIMARLAEQVEEEQKERVIGGEATAHGKDNDDRTATSSDTDDDDDQDSEPTVKAATSDLLNEESPVPFPSSSTSGTAEHTKEDQTNRNNNLILSESFKAGTAVSHKAAEDVHFVRNFIRGKIDPVIFAELVVQLYHVYAVLEELLQVHSNHNNNTDMEEKTDAPLAPLAHLHEPLRRTHTLAEDLDYWHGPDVTARVVAEAKEYTHDDDHHQHHTPTASFPSTLDHATLSPAARDYIQRLHDCARTDPRLLLAHTYTRYLGDLSGGKVLARVARSALHLGKGPDNGLAFYDFSDIASATAFKRQYRAALDDLVLTDAQIEALVAEANVAFVLNMRVFEELDVRANVPGARVRPLAEALAFAETATTEEEETAAPTTIPPECPFANMAAATAKTTRSGSTKAIPAECPFATTASTAAKDVTTTPNKAHSGGSGGGRCPWPFVLLHDPMAALADWQTWALAGLILCFVWSKVQ